MRGTPMIQGQNFLKQAAGKLNKVPVKIPGAKWGYSRHRRLVGEYGWFEIMRTPCKLTLEEQKMVEEHGRKMMSEKCLMEE